MALLPRVALVAGALAVFLQAGCGTATRPTIIDVDLALAASPAVGGPSLPIVADVRASNVGNTRVWHYGVGLRVLGPDGAEVVWLGDPNAPPPVAPSGQVLPPDMAVPLEPGRDFTRRFAFTGELYVTGHPTWPSPTYPAPPGTYTMIAYFRYATSVPWKWITLERRATFAWVP